MVDYNIKDNPRAIYHTLSRGNMELHREESLQKAIENGMIPRNQLQDGIRYVGYCRNASVATWNAEQGKFVYDRHKFGSVFKEEIVHPEDDEGFDIFVPVKEYLKDKNNDTKD